MFNSKRITTGIRLEPQNATAPSLAGDIRYNSSTDQLESYDTALRNIVTDTGAQTLTNKTLDASSNTVSNIVNANISGSAAIAYSKLNLTGNIVNADISGSAAIAYSKLALTGNIVNADISASAAIAVNKIAPLTVSKIAVTDASGFLTTSVSAASKADFLQNVASNLAGITDSATLTNKTFGDAPTFTQIVTPSTPASGFNKIYPKSDGKFYSLDPSGAERQVGSGAGTINYITNNDAESGTTGYATYKDAAGSSPVDGTGGVATHITITSSSSSPLRGTKSFLMSNSGSSSAQGEGVSYDFSIDPADQATVLQIAFDYTIASGTFVSGNSSDVQVFIYDVTNSILIPVAPSTIQGGSTNDWHFKGVFQTASNSTSYRLILHVASTNTSAWGFKFDNVQVGPQAVVYGATITDWTAYTPTYAGLGTVTGSNMFYRRVGGNAEIRGYFTTGTVTGATAQIGLPSGLSVTSSALLPAISIVGYATYAVATGTTFAPAILATPATTYLNIGIQNTSSGGLIPQLGNAIFNNSMQYSLFASVPIQGWASSVLMSNDTDTRVVAMSVPPVSGTLTTTPGNNITWGSTTIDTHGAFSSGTYTIPVSGFYKIYGQVGAGSNGTFGSAVNVAKNGVAQSPTFIGPPNAVNSTLCNFEYLGKFIAGDTVQVWSNVTTGTQAVSSSGVWNLERLTGPSAIATTETVAARYTNSPSGSVPTALGTTFNFATKDYDTHGAVTTGASWVFTAPIAGKYSVKAATGVNCSVVAAFVGAIYKNGSAYTTATSSQFVAGNFNSTISISDDINLLAGDTVSVQFYTGGQAALYNNNQQIAIVRLGN